MATARNSASNAHPWKADGQWRAVLDRDRTFDDRFVFAVRSTKIYCRPSCPSRRPRREQVSFFRTPRAAEDAGYRACRRCRPDKAHPHAQLVQHICRLLDAAVETQPTLKMLGDNVGMSPWHLQRTFKQCMGISPRQYALARRLDVFKQETRKGRSVSAALYEAGFGSSSRLYEHSKSHLGMTPRTYQRGGKGMHIRYAITPSPLGRLLVAGTEHGICFLCLGDADRPLEMALRKEYPSAEIRAENALLKPWIGAVIRHLQGELPDIRLPIDVEATAFQWKVWKKLQAIPYGSTRTYSQIARALGNPRAHRAVARACATNRVSIVIPCHRVVREDGGLGGYRWGLKRKKALLKMEKSHGA